MKLRMEDITVVRGGSRILDTVSLSVPEGSFFVLMGPTGSGKTTLLRTGGLIDRPDSGTVSFNGIHVPPRGSGRTRLSIRRRMATMFQHPVMLRGTVRDNVQWGLQVRGLSPADRGKRADAMLELMDLGELAGRDASSLSGGERSRTALARALALEPELLFLDEPTTSIHPTLKRALLERITDIHERTGITIIMATHDFTDALSVGSLGAVMNEGRIEQTGTIEEILFSPGSHFMASFTGMRNILPAEFHDNEAQVGNLSIRFAGSRDGQGYLAIPPEAVVISLTETVTSERNRFPGLVRRIRREGITWDVLVDVSGVEMHVTVTTGALDELEIAPGSKVNISFKASAVHLF